MEDWEIDVKNHWNKVSDSDWYNSLRSEERLNLLMNNPQSAFHPMMFEMLNKYVGDFKGKKILLPSSGDNHAAFAFALMGADVTSADISERQLENAKAISDKLGLSINFVCDNTLYLATMPENFYDLVYTSNGTLTWIGDIQLMYKNFAKVLKNGGISAMYDIHPFTRPFTGAPWEEPKITKAYSDIFPDLHWRVQDIINANIDAGLQISQIAELPAVDASFWYTYDELKTKTGEEIRNINDWKHNPMAALPAWMAMISCKKK